MQKNPRPIGYSHFYSSCGRLPSGKPIARKNQKKDEKLRLTLVKNPDIARSLGEQKNTGQVHVGFALETDEGIGSAENKLKTKNFDFIVLNSLLDPEAGFQKTLIRLPSLIITGKAKNLLS